MELRLVLDSSDFKSTKAIGYGAKTTLAIDIKDVANVGRVIDVIMVAGATNISEIRFLSTREEDARASALRSAVAAATLRAKVMAEAAGGQLGALVELSTEPRPGWRADEITVSAEATGVAGTQIPPPEVQVSAVIYATWRYVPAPK